MEEEKIIQDVSAPMIEGAVHSVAVGDERDYRALANVKVLVDRCFKEVQDGRLNPKVALKVLREDLKLILIKY